MRTRSVFIVLVVVPVAVVAWVLTVAPAAGQTQGKGVVEFPGIGRVDLDKLDPEFRDNLRIPGQAYEQPPEEGYGDLPPPVFKQPTDDSDLPYRPDLNAQPAQRTTPGHSAADVGGTGGDSSGRAATAHEEALKRKREALQRMYNDRAYPFGKIPDRAYENAWKHIQEMPPAPAAPTGDAEPADLEPQSLWERAKGWFLARLSPPGVIAQGSTPPWAPAGPAPLFPGPPYSSRIWAGYVGQVAVHPTDLNTVYVGTYGGIWKTTDGGVTWSNLTNDQETQRMNRLILHPSNAGILYAGTGWGVFTDVGPFEPDGSAELGRGILRSTDAGSSWCRIGPAVGGANDSSRLAIFNIAADPSSAPMRLYVATDQGLFYSVNSTETDCSRVGWTQVHGGLPAGRITNILVGKWGKPRTLYASSDMWFYRSEDGGTTWLDDHFGLPLFMTTRNVAAIAKNPPPQPTPTPQQDTLYLAVIAQTPCYSYCGEGLYRGISVIGWGTTWTRLAVAPALGAGFRSVEIHPDDPNTVVVGSADLLLSTDGGNTFSNLTAGGPEGVHGDHNDLVFGPPVAQGNPNSLYTGNDGGIWRRDRYDTGLFNNWNGNLGNFLFYRGTIDTLNHGVSWGGTQDNGDMKAGNRLVWYQIQGGDGYTSSIDYTNSNIAYFVDRRTTDGGGTTEVINQGLSSAYWQTMVMDPSNSKALVIYDLTSKQVKRRVFGIDTAWNSITDNPATGIPDVNCLVIAPPQLPPNPSNLIFAGSAPGIGPGGNIWRTSDASTWTLFSTPGNGLPNAAVTSLAIAPGSCSVPNCTVYASVSGFGTPHVFRSTDAGATWISISGSGASVLPDLPVNKVVVHPTNSTVLWVGTDLGVLQGCASSDGTTCSSSGTTWIWGTFGTGLPAGVFVQDLQAHKESGLLRAFTFGRGAWEAQALSPPNPDQLVNTTNPVTDVYHNTVRIGTGNSGQRYGVAWVDDRNGLNNSHAYYRAYSYDANGQPLASSANDFRVDDTASTHAVQTVSISGHPTVTSYLYPSWVAWSDDRLDRVHQHVYYQWIQTNGNKLFVSDARADTNNSVNATNPAVTYEPNLHIATAWQAENGGLHDIYARFLSNLGAPKPNPCNGNLTDPVRVNVQGLDATLPAAAADASGSVFIAWQEYDSAALNGKIMIRKYDTNGCPLSAPVPVDNNGLGGTTRNEVALATAANAVCSTASRTCGTDADCPSGEHCTRHAIIAAWWEGKSDGSQPETVNRRRLTSDLGPLDDEVQVNNPPLAPPGAQRGARASVATDTSKDSVISWQANVNDFTANTWNGFARTYDRSGTTLKNDFRIDLTPRTAAARSPRVARSSQAGKFAYAWRDNRSGHYDVYTRGAPSVP